MTWLHPNGQLQCMWHGAAFEKHPEVTLGPECSNTQADMCTPQYALIIPLLGPSYLENCLYLIISACPTRVSTVCVSSVKQGLRKFAFSVTGHPLEQHSAWDLDGLHPVGLKNWAFPQKTLVKTWDEPVWLIGLKCEHAVIGHSGVVLCCVLWFLGSFVILFYVLIVC